MNKIKLTKFVYELENSLLVFSDFVKTDIH